VAAGDQVRDLGERAMLLSAKQHSLLQHCYLMIDTAPLAQQHGTYRELAHRRDFHGPPCVSIVGDALEQASGRWFETAEPAFLHFRSRSPVLMKLWKTCTRANFEEISGECTLRQSFRVCLDFG
jgi:hypothetical protein